MMHYSRHDVASERNMCTQSTHTKGIDYKLTVKCVDILAKQPENINRLICSSTLKQLAGQSLCSYLAMLKDF